MTQRIVWLMGVAAVATMVILAGCGDGPGAKPAEPAEPPDSPDPPATNYVTALVGTWTATAEVLVDPSNPASAVQHAITAIVAAGDMANTGTLTLSVVSTAVITMQQGDPTIVTGNIAVDASAITVTITAVDPPPDPTDPSAAAIAAVLAAPQSLSYTLSDDGNMLTVGNDRLLPLLLGGSTSIELTKGMANS